jgi:hypothetical protein
MKAATLVTLLLIFMGPVLAQRDFLTADEADQIRLAQDPNLRIGLYIGFAKQRMDLLDQLFAENKTGRSTTVHLFLEQLTNIIETLDVVIDDALKHKKEILALPDVAKAEREFEARLQKHRESNPSDLARYKFVLDTAIDTLSDSAGLAEEDLRDRVRGVESKEVQSRKQREEMLTPEGKEEAKKAETKKVEEDTKAKKKPTLLRKGETLPSSTGKQ